MMYGLLVVAVMWGVVFLLVRRELSAAWDEPCLRHPVLVFEGDDWGYGPLAQADALRDIAQVLGRYTDVTGRHPVMTLGVILSGPDAAQGQDPQAIMQLDHTRLAPVLAAMKQGVEQGVFALQLHGMQHYHPDVLDQVARHDPAVARWRRQDLPLTEDLPSRLQSQWTDAATLPSRPLGLDDIRARVASEVAAFTRVFGAPPAVVVPPTFVWNEAVERTWAESGVRVIVTPGERYEARGADGVPIDTDQRYRNGQRCASGLMAMVRDDYYEPVRGHRAARGLEALACKWRQRRPVLLETHRSNFVGPTAQHADSLRSIEALVAAALVSHPELRFVSVEELADRYAKGGELIDARIRARIFASLCRLDRPGRRRKVFVLLIVLTVVLPWVFR